MENLANSIGGLGCKSQIPKLDHAQEAFQRGAAQYMAKHGRKLPVIILDNMSTRSKKFPKTFNDLQDDVKTHADLRSVWSRAKTATVIGDFTEEELDYLAKVGIEKMLNHSMSLWVVTCAALRNVRQMVLTEIEESFEEADMARTSGNFDVSKPVILELLKEGAIKYARFRELVLNKDLVNELLQHNVFSYNPAEKPSNLVWRRRM
ncbi:hypothetical protein BC937DRAFT_90139 [Endogone sp. FLAS-F59071]|nr:hypothetical protein BC937DRAFT_90139 [Endogone sp. FLAS-F59071]|eukprot:RUS17314.1 hypothetical protein BC937DRAFT_90139 [Endogone sp. FLAS-F59071]